VRGLLDIKKQKRRQKRPLDMRQKEEDNKRQKEEDKKRTYIEKKMDYIT
jgi:hypothetical protein